MFDVIYNYINNFLLNSNLGLASVDAWNLDLAYLLSAVSIVLIFICIVLFIRAVGRYVFDLFLFR